MSRIPPPTPDFRVRCKKNLIGVSDPYVFSARISYRCRPFKHEAATAVLVLYPYREEYVRIPKALFDEHFEVIDDRQTAKD